MSGLLSIDLSAIQSNWKQVDASSASETQTAAVVKANAYGLGVQSVAPALYMAGCRHFFVANLVEAIEVKACLESDVQIYILTGLRVGEEALCLQQGFIPVLSSLGQVKAWAKACVDGQGENKRLATNNCVIKVDTGMHRLGLSEQELSTLCSNYEVMQACPPLLLMSHLACADAPEHVLNQQQLACFRRCAEMMQSVWPQVKLSLANSSGICLGSDFHFDMVRPGACLYGVNPTPQFTNPMATVARLRLPILQIKSVGGPATVGYEARYSIAEGENKKLAIVAGGYADGLFNHLSNRGFAYLAKKRVPLVGRVSMDSMVFDISAVDEAELEFQEQPCVEILNDDHGVDALAAEAGTIGYEVLTALGNRYHRQYDGLSE